MVNKIKSERSLNRILSPVTNRGGSKPLPYKTDPCIFHSYVNTKAFMMLDVITDIFVKKWNECKMFSEDPYNYFRTNSEKGMTIYITLDDLYTYHFLTKYTFSELKLIFKASRINISNFKFRLKTEIKSDKNKRKRYHYINLNHNGTPTYLYDVDNVNSKSIIPIKFNNEFGYGFLNNIILKGVDYFPVVLYEMSDFTQNLYRKFFMESGNKKDITITFSMNDVRESLNINHPNSICNEITNSLDTIKRFNLIKKFSYYSIRKRAVFEVSK